MRNNINLQSIKAYEKQQVKFKVSKIDIHQFSAIFPTQEKWKMISQPAFMSESQNGLIVGFLLNSHTSASHIAGDITCGGGGGCNGKHFSFVIALQLM